MPSPTPSRPRGALEPRGCRWRPTSQRGSRRAPRAEVPLAAATSLLAPGPHPAARARSSYRRAPPTTPPPPCPAPRPRPAPPPALRPAPGRDERGCAEHWGPAAPRHTSELGVGSAVGGERDRGGEQGSPHGVCVLPRSAFLGLELSRSEKYHKNKMKQNQAIPTQEGKRGEQEKGTQSQHTDRGFADLIQDTSSQLSCSFILLDSPCF
ncbi:uncharacterized protein LOC113178714 [Urocitellus parryii]